MGRAGDVAVDKVDIVDIVDEVDASGRGTDVALGFGSLILCIDRL